MFLIRLASSIGFHGCPAYIAIQDGSEGPVANLKFKCMDMKWNDTNVERDGGISTVAIEPGCFRTGRSLVQVGLLI